MQFPVNYINITQFPHSNGDYAVDLGRGDTKNGGINQPIYACSNGYVKKCEVQPNGGNAMYIDYDNGYRSCYAHLKSFNVKEKERVKEGQLVGIMGNTGKVTGYHLHFALFPITNKIDYGKTNINPFTVCEVHPNQTLSPSTLKDYGHLFKYKDNIKYVVNVDEEGLNVRKKPNGKIINQIYIGDKVTIYEESGSWSRIGDNKWVYSSYLSYEKPIIYEVNTGNLGGLNVRNKPSLKNSRILKVLPNNTKVTSYKTSGSWIAINKKATKWVSKNYLHKL